MSKVWVTVVGIEYEGEDVTGVFSTREKAEAFNDKLSLRWYDYVEIYEFELDLELDEDY